ncbi:chromosome segregation in meiosis- protein [Cadophora gregata]|uniref:chromosome segregation in meiosis- protein n=1 Tax=Cadophora gregata TaxID=51156 RepID=UPI0026DD373F|nr:chromosome segregation in meiosis- protein [Cadophora gregata]KAK0105835.1 chromosome segregation in meiosis- protein [Cadophora gregata]
MPDTNARPLPTEGPSAGGDEFDDLFNYDADMNDPFSDNYVAPAAKERQRQIDAAAKTKGGAGLGIDEEVEVTRKARAPRVKLDENRLLSANGIPKLRNRAKQHLKLKGKGHEYSDAAKLLSFYQIWLDDLFPKARFLDALAMVEKMGHKKRIQMMRMEWINEGKPQTVNDDSVNDPPANENDGREKTAPRIAPIFENAAGGDGPKTPGPNDSTAVDEDMEDDDLYGATPRASRTKPVQATVSQTDSLFGGTGASIFGPAKKVVDDFGPDDDELDALLAEEEMNQNMAGSKPAPVINKAAPRDEVDEDEMEAMNDMDMW